MGNLFHHLLVIEVFGAWDPLQLFGATDPGCKGSAWFGGARGTENKQDDFSLFWEETSA